MRNRYIYITLLAILGLTPDALAQKEKIQYAPRLVVNICIDQLRTDYMEAFAAAGVKLITLSNYEAVVEEAAKTGYIKDEDKAVLAEWRKNPSTWGVKS